MKTIKPNRLGLLTKVFENDGEPYLVVTLLVFFPFEAPRRLLYEQSLWRFAGAELGSDAILDECMPKLRGELLVNGRCFTAGAVPRTACSVRVQLGAIDKTLYVVGDRRFGLLGMTEPEPFAEMPITWRNAFGGEGYAPNPIGKGFAPVRSENGSVHPLPNIEDPRRLVRSPGDRPPPAGFGGYDPTWPQRFSKVGTYDEAWLKERFPELAKDLDWSFFNTAPPDQQVEGYFRGDEAFVIENMHPGKPRIEGALPGVATRCFINQKTGEGEAFREIATRLDTVRLFPHHERGILVYRGVLKICEDDAADVLHIVAGCEAMGEPRPVEHYRTVMAQRLDKEKGHLFLLRDADLLPPPQPGAGPLPDDPQAEMTRLLQSERLWQKRARAKMERDIEELKAKIRAQGLDPEPLVAPLPPDEDVIEPSLDELPAYVERAMTDAEKVKADAEARRAAEEQRARAECAKHGFDYDAIMGERQKEAGGPPRFSAKKELERLEDAAQMARNGGVEWPELEAQLGDPELAARLFEVEEQMRSAYRKFAHHYPAASRLGGEEAARVREEVIAGHRAGESFAGRDLTGADLSHLDLSGIDLEGALLEAAVLTGTRLCGANIAGAVLARANLLGADLTGANLAGANFGGANLSDVKMGGGLDLTGAVLAKAKLSGADLTGARLSDADLSEATFDGADFSRVTARNLVLINADLSGAQLSGADLEQCTFIEANVEGVDFRGANLRASVFITGKGDGAVFRGAKLDNIRLIAGSSFAGADFRGASLEQANLRGTCLRGSDFTEANLRSSDLSECDLTGARLDRAVAVGAMLTRADLTGASLSGIDLMEAVLQKAKVDDANFERANLFRVDAAKMRGNAATSLKGANVKYVRFVAPPENHGQK
ncbi:DUF2169 domain-containing protein [Sorangium sp. So ce260]|uniref:DUF2169 family type VI secretion system accessory protein n=1 Tax=Sorangium sp. So ce260 TaxID=3133291 RepID=UPI003F642E60